MDKHPRLNAKTLSQAVDLPPLGYDRSQVSIGIGHIGVGHFHRTHQAVYTEEVMRRGQLRWGILGVSLASPRALEQLNPQDGLYSVRTLSPGSEHIEVIGAVQAVRSPATHRNLTRQLAEPQVQVITLTATEKGYCAAGQALDRSHPDIEHDLKDDVQPRSVPGFIARVLQERRKRSQPITLLSCDNLSGNGDVLRQVVIEFAELHERNLARWIEQHVTFPNAMVDRIAPQTTDEDRSAFSDRYGLYDAGHVLCEPFSQWVIENQFAADRPPWDIAGAQFVQDVRPFERAKLRLLNGTHSACAYLGRLLGYEYVHEVLQDKPLRAHLQKLAEHEVLAVTELPEGLDGAAYLDQVLARFANSAVPYRNQQVASDGSQKIPQRWCGPLQTLIERKAPFKRLAFAMACWMEHLKDPAPDPMADQLKQIYRQNPSAKDLVAAVLTQTDIFDQRLRQSGALQNEVTQALEQLRRFGAAAAVAQLL